MTECTDKRFERMLYAWELGMLSGDDATALEEHLYECDHCFFSARQFTPFALQLRRSPRIASEIRDAVKSRTSTVFTRLLLIAAALLVVAIPVYKLVLEPRQPGVVQSLYLEPMRGNSQSVVDRALRGQVQIHFVVEGVTQAHVYQVAISARNGSIVYVNNEFSDFNSFGQGQVVIPVDSLDQGYYSLTVSDVEGSDTVTLVKYPFRVK